MDYCIRCSRLREEKMKEVDSEEVLYHCPILDRLILPLAEGTTALYPSTCDTLALGQADIDTFGCNFFTQKKE